MSLIFYLKKKKVKVAFQAANKREKRAEHLCPYEFLLNISLMSNPRCIYCKLYIKYYISCTLDLSVKMSHLFVSINNLSKCPQSLLS